MRASLIARLAAAIVGTALAALAPACGTVRYSQPNGDFRVPDFSFGGGLNAVAATAPDAAWVVGYTGLADNYKDWRTLMLHWDGTRWTRVASPAVLNGALGSIEGITALSPTDAWAVGFTNPSTIPKPLLLHWDGTQWTQVTDALPTSGSLEAITITAKGGGWAVGQEVTAAKASKPLILRWDGHGWHKIPGPAAPDESAPKSVAVTSQDTAWATAFVHTASNSWRPEMMRLTASSWGQAAFPLDRPNIQLFQVASAPDGTAWAVGQDATGYDASRGGIQQPPVTMRWTGTTWQAVPVPGVKAAGLEGVTVAADGTAWAVGGTADGLLSVRWTGSTWETESVPIGDFPDSNGTLDGVAFDSSADGWAVGFWAPNSGNKPAKPLIVHWDGASWN
jgi:hypothetical protein